MTRPWIGGAILAPPGAGPKRIENRKWRPESILGERFALHSGKVFDEDADCFICELLGVPDGTPDRPPGWMAEGVVATAVCAGYVVKERGHLYPYWYHLPCGEVRMHADLGDQERWWIDRPGNVAWLLEDVRPLRSPVPARGYQGLWTLTREQEMLVVSNGGVP